MQNIIKVGGFMFTLNLETKNTLDAEKIYDLIIVGSGPAGLSAAIYAARKGLSVGVVGAKHGGQVRDTASVENYIGFEFVTGQGLAEQFEKHVKSLPVDIGDAQIKNIRKDNVFYLEADNYQTYKGKTVLIATGSKPRKLGVEGEDVFYGKGVSYCAICDGPLFAGKTVAIVGGGNSAVEAAIDLSKLAVKVVLIHRSKLKADQILIDKLYDLNNVEIHLKTQIKSILGQEQVSKVEVAGDTQGMINTDGVLVEIGYLPNSDFIDVEKTSGGEIVIDHEHQTSQEGIFAAGDVTTEKYKQIIVAASEGAKAALSINEYFNNK
jgi:alkyl hydroperoxide reductase subunit F